jgi:GH25 family lysozyme M1 (1,4-beta-N-acetylmuramidase)
MANCFGIDASHYNTLSQAGLNSAKAAGATWFTHKASEGNNFLDPNFATAIAWARNAGFVVGAYHVVRSSPSVATQGAYFLNAITNAGYNWQADPNFIFQVDLEKWSYDAVPATMGIQLAQWLLDNTGRKAVFLYASKGEYGNTLIGAPVKLWNANYPTYNSSAGSCPSESYTASYAHSGADAGPGWITYSNQMPVFWQYSDNATFGSLNGLDASAFRGTVDQFMALINTPVAPLPPDVDPPFPPVAITPGPAEIDVTGVGTVASPFSVNWHGLIWNKFASRPAAISNGTTSVLLPWTTDGGYSQAAFTVANPNTHLICHRSSTYIQVTRIRFNLNAASTTSGGYLQATFTENGNFSYDSITNTYGASWVDLNFVESIPRLQDASYGVSINNFTGSNATNGAAFTTYFRISD